MNTLVLAPQLDDRYKVGTVTSRIGLQSDATAFTQQENLYKLIEKQHQAEVLSCVLVDEAQFLTKQQVSQLGHVADILNIPVLAYGIRTDFQGEPFEGSLYLLAWSDNLKELKAICHCGSKATMVLRQDKNGKVISEGSQIAIGGNDLYVSVCRKHFNKSMAIEPKLFD